MGSAVAEMPGVRAGPAAHVGRCQAALAALAAGCASARRPARARRRGGRADAGRGAAGGGPSPRLGAAADRPDARGPATGCSARTRARAARRRGPSRSASSRGRAGSSRGRRPGSRSTRTSPESRRRPSSCLPLDGARASAWVAELAERDRGARAGGLPGPGRVAPEHVGAAARPPGRAPRGRVSGGSLPAEPLESACGSASAGRSGTGKSSLIAALCRGPCGRARDRRRDERHLHDRGRPLPARAGGPPGRADRGRPDRLLPAHGDPRRHLDEPARRRGARAGGGAARRRLRRERRRQPDGVLQPGARRHADLRARLRRRRRRPPQGRPRASPGRICS